MEMPVLGLGITDKLLFLREQETKKCFLFLARSLSRLVYFSSYSSETKTRSYSSFILNFFKLELERLMLYHLFYKNYYCKFVINY